MAYEDDFMRRVVTRRAPLRTRTAEIEEEYLRRFGDSAEVWSRVEEALDTYLDPETKPKVKKPKIQKTKESILSTEKKTELFTKLKLIQDTLSNAVRAMDVDGVDDVYGINRVSDDCLVLEKLIKDVIEA